MCAIAGIWGGDRPAALEAAVLRMVDAQRHRGPDEQRVAALPTPGGTLALGFDRLAILDLGGTASQPMHHPATGSWLVFNGEIYNFRSLRAELEQRGHRFRSSGDAEVLLAALVEWGTAALPRLRGMYAFAFFDGRTRRLVLARDPFGIKPLLYGRPGGTFVFASELRAVLAAGRFDLSLDRAALDAYLTYGAIPEPHTIVREIAALPPGYVLEVDPRDGAAVPRPVVTLDACCPPGSDAPSWAEAIDRAGATLADAVRAHLVSDVPLGVLLSGGVDSTLVASLAARAGAAPQFLTVGFDEPRFDEVAAARATARRLGGRHHVVSLSASDVLAFLPEALAAMDQPTADGVNTFVITRAAAARGIKVLVSGLGGDELFGGYTTFRKAPLLATHARRLAPLARALGALGVGNAAQWAKIAGARDVGDLRAAYLVQRALGADVPDDGRCGLPADTWAGLATRPGDSGYRAVSALEVGFYLRSQLLHDADVFASANAVELRVPFLDLAVLRLAWQLPAAWHLGRGGARKGVLRALLHRLEPRHRIARTKRGFAFPWAAWLDGPLGDRVADSLADRDAHEALGLDPADGRRLLAAYRWRDPRVGWSQLWSRFVLVEWQRRTALDAVAARAPARQRARVPA
jgi:asparagine synthase (glutamine-hydrolysing)